jgi:ribonuclease E
MPHNLKKLKHYTDPVPLFTRFQIESQIESAFTHSVNLPSGGSIVIDHTEALVSIDINSARATKGGDIEATALNTNLEAAEEIARQLRIRDLGGLIVIDFIDMGPQKHQRDVENRLRDSVRQDRARVQIGKISRFGLLEMSRQRLRPSLGDSAYLTCPRCSGIGTIRSVESLALAILRIIGEEARKERTAKVIAQLPVEVATYLLNEKRDWVQSLESRNEMQVVLVANPALETPHYDVRRVRDDQADLPENAGASYELAAPEREPETPQEILARKAVEPAAIAVMKPSTPAPKRQKESKGLLAAITALFTGGSKEAAAKKSPPRRRKSSSQDSRARGGQRKRPSGDSRRGEEKPVAGRKRTKKAGGKKKAAARDGADQAKDSTRRSKQGAKKPPQQKQAAQDKRDDAQADTQKPARKRRSRGGRRRRRDSDRPVQEPSAEQQQTQQQAQPPGENSKPRNDSGPPKVRTDAERAADAAAKPQKPQDLDQAAPQPAPKERPAPAREAQPEPKPEPRLVPDAKPKPQPEAKSEPKPVPQPEAKPAPKPVPQPEAQPVPKPPAIPASKPEGRLLPWDEPAPKPAEAPKPPPVSVDNPPQD